MNRQQRRALARGKARTPMVKMGLLTLKEAEVMTEALDSYAVQLEEETEPTGEQVWAIGRARALRDLLQASIEDRPVFDEHAEREPA